MRKRPVGAFTGWPFFCSMRKESVSPCPPLPYGRGIFGGKNSTLNMRLDRLIGGRHNPRSLCLDLLRARRADSSVGRAQD